MIPTSYSLSSLFFQHFLPSCESGGSVFPYDFPAGCNITFDLRFQCLYVVAWLRTLRVTGVILSSTLIGICTMYLILLWMFSEHAISLHFTSILVRISVWFPFPRMMKTDIITRARKVENSFLHVSEWVINFPINTLSCVKNTKTHV